MFGDNIERDLGRARYLAFDLLCGILASVPHVMLNTEGPKSRRTIPFGHHWSGTLTQVLSGMPQLLRVTPFARRSVKTLARAVGSPSIAILPLGRNGPIPLVATLSETLHRH